ncbi:MarR family winged helix-turn-helix transcriptional regulator [Sanguibacter antarcticus]|uniref:MarR family transcriptional regulator n=1 Tax=Sanguibacter antarcticus TaxID=372484 RepID=A0A2A9E833_9MICO|nr:MarR family transcriptional regulator [Sanguibacter antarcticus]PFG34389.1 MarR family transcriptional regulator [Sanguibacter antarcticus]
MPIPGSSFERRPAPQRVASPEEMRAWVALLETTAIVQHAADRRLRDEIGLPTTQFEILARIVEGPDDGLRMTEIADRLVISPSGLTYQVTQLVERGLAERGAQATDERVVLVRITDAGRALVAQGIPEYVDVVTTMLLDHLTADDLTTLTDILEGVRAQLRSAPRRPRRGGTPPDARQR